MPVSATSTEVRVFLSFQQFVVSRFIVRQQIGMESMYQVFQYNFGLHGHTFVEGFLTHVAVYHSLLTKRTEVGITRVEGLQGIIRECPVIAVDNAPIVGTLRLAIYGFKIQRDTSRTGSSFKK